MLLRRRQTESLRMRRDGTQLVSAARHERVDHQQARRAGGRATALARVPRAVCERRVRARLEMGPHRQRCGARRQRVAVRLDQGSAGLRGPYEASDHSSGVAVQATARAPCKRRQSM